MLLSIPSCSVSSGNTEHRFPECSGLCQNSFQWKYPFPVGDHEEEGKISEEQLMQLGHLRLTLAEQNRSFMAGECLYCDQKGHYMYSCPAQPEDHAHTVVQGILVGEIATSHSPPRFMLPAKLTIQSTTHSLKALTDSRVNESISRHDPKPRLPEQLYFPTPVWSRVLQWADMARFTCHSGIHRTISFLECLFWWPMLAQDAEGLPFNEVRSSQTESRKLSPNLNKLNCNLYSQFIAIWASRDFFSSEKSLEPLEIPHPLRNHHILYTLLKGK